MTMVQKQTAMVLGGFVADAASLGLHWLYDVERITEVGGTTPEFIEPNADHYENAKKGAFVHYGKTSGSLSHYGEMAFIMLKTLSETQNKTDFRVRDFMSHFKKSFGPGGSWVGYIDKPIGATLRNYDDYLSETAHHNDKGKDMPPCGAANDMQLPAVCRLFVLIGILGVRTNNITEKIERCIKLTNDNKWALAWGRTVSALQMASLLSDNVDVILQSAVNASPRDIQATILEASQQTQANVNQIADNFGRACLLAQGIPVCLHILRHANSYTDAIRMNILAGGDSCGRAMVIGPLAGALFGVGGANGIPLAWISKIHLNSEIMTLTEKALLNTIA